MCDADHIAAQRFVSFAPPDGCIQRGSLALLLLMCWSVIASEAKQSRENPGGAIRFETPSWIASSLRYSQ
jgi:hypothetical protein